MSIPHPLLRWALYAAGRQDPLWSPSLSVLLIAPPLPAVAPESRRYERMNAANILILKMLKIGLYIQETGPEIRKNRQRKSSKT